MANPFSFRKEPPCCCGCRDLLQEAVKQLQIAANHLKNINTSTALIGNEGGVIQKLSEANELTKQALQKETQIMADLTNLTNQVQQNTTVEQSAVTLIQGLAAQIAAAGTDPAALQALQDQLNSSANSLAAAVAANTPSA